MGCFLELVESVDSADSFDLDDSVDLVDLDEPPVLGEGLEVLGEVLAAGTEAEPEAEFAFNVRIGAKAGSEAVVTDANDTKRRNSAGRTACFLPL